MFNIEFSLNSPLAAMNEKYTSLDKFTYLGSILLTPECDIKDDVQRSNVAAAAFGRCAAMIVSYTIATPQQPVTCKSATALYISQLLYGPQTWVDVFHTRCLQPILGLQWYNVAMSKSTAKRPANPRSTCLHRGNSDGLMTRYVCHPTMTWRGCCLKNYFFFRRNVFLSI